MQTVKENNVEHFMHERCPENYNMCVYHMQMQTRWEREKFKWNIVVFKTF